MSEMVTVVGAGLAGCEAAWQLAQRGISVRLCEMKPVQHTPAHHSDDFAELVCSNSLRSDQLENAVGLLKEELRRLGSLILRCADEHRVAAGGALAVDRTAFAQAVTDAVRSHPLITVEEGEVTALVGPSGSGKSTCARLAARLWDVTEGTIRVGGVDISTVDPEALLTDYSMVFQDVVLFDDTVMENIRLGKRGATDEEVRAAAEAANCGEFIRRLPQGYDTPIGENGAKLSGGERQRISIARALLKDAPIVLLDEATASLDVENETKVQGALSRLLAGKTVLVIAHRMRTVAGADHIVVLEDGHVAQQGAPAELMEQGGLYRRMVELQSESAQWRLNGAEAEPF